MTRVRLLLLPFAFFLLLLACAKPETRVVIQKVEIPVATYPTAPPRRPLIFPVNGLSADASDGQKASALKATFLYLLGRYEEAEALLDGYRSKELQK